MKYKAIVQRTGLTNSVCMYFSSRALYCDLKIVIWWEEKHKFERRKFPTKKNILQKFEFDLLRLFGLLKKNFGFQKDFFFFKWFSVFKKILSFLKKYSVSPFSASVIISY